MSPEKIRRFSTKDIINLRNPSVVAIGGGTGLSSILRGIKEYTDNITAIVTVGDDGGSSGRLRADMGLLPPGDIRNCILALAEDENLMTDLFNYRFSEGELKGHNFGNLFLAAMDGISYDFYQAIRRTSEVLHIKGQVLPVTLDPMILCAKLENGTIIEGESTIPEVASKEKSKIAEIYLRDSELINPLVAAIEAIEEANRIILGPGSLFTSVICNLLVPRISQAIKNSNALTFWITNLATQVGETTDMTQEEHLKQIQKYLGSENEIDVIIQNNGEVPEEINRRYIEAGQEFIKPLKEAGNSVLLSDDLLLIEGNKLRHKTDRVAELLFNYYLNQNTIKK